MLSDFINNLQNKPEQTKIKVLYFSAGLTIILVLAIWISSFGEYKAAFNNPMGDNEAMNSLKASVLDSVFENENQEAEIKSQRSNKETVEIKKTGNQKPETVGISGANPPAGIEESENSTNNNFQIDEKEEEKVFKLPVE